jgi:orotate phosphoribosyltransferase
MPELVTMSVTPSEKQIAKFLLEIGAVKFNVENPFIWTSGIKSPIYCDNRIINSKVEVRDAVIAEFSNIIHEKYSDIDTVAGLATGGISYGAIIASRLNLPFIYVRAERKQHGLMKIVEGEFTPGEKVVLIEDHISFGGSSIRGINYLKDEGIEVVSLLSIMTYDFQEAIDAYKKEGIQYHSICHLNTILQVALEENRLSQNDVEAILLFRKDPHAWGRNI